MKKRLLMPLFALTLLGVWAYTAMACNCGDEKCIAGRVQRCMAGGGGKCVWYPTNEVCLQDELVPKKEEVSPQEKTEKPTEPTSEKKSLK